MVTLDCRVASLTAMTKGWTGRCRGCLMVPLDCRVASLTAMTKGGTGMGEVLRHGFRMPDPVLSFRGRSRRELTWQSSLGRYVGCPGDAVGCPMVPTGLPRRGAPRNDNAKTWGMPKRSLDCRVAALLAMTKGGTGMGEVVRHGFRMPGPVLSLRGRSRRELTWQSSLRRYAGCRGDAGVAQWFRLDCRVAGLLAMTTQKHGGCPNGRWIAASLRSSQ
jgi:hypothetical protein